MKTKESSFNKNKKFVAIIIISVVATFFLANHIADLMFGSNSLEVYNSLKENKKYLKNEIQRYQQENARLQKEYFELKNLEPE